MFITIKSNINFLLFFNLEINIASAQAEPYRAQQQQKYTRRMASTNH